MLTGEELEKALQKIMERLDELNVFYIQKIAAQIKKIGALSQTSINRLIIMSEVGADMLEIEEKLREITGLNQTDMMNVYQKALDDAYTDPRFKNVVEHKPLSEAQKRHLLQYVNNVAAVANNNIVNISNTSYANEFYRETVDKAILAVSQGYTSYNDAMVETLRQLGESGFQVRYPSGYHRRLDSSVRQNIIDGVRDINQSASLEIGRDLGFDAVELSAHLASAPDHEPVQGRVFLNAEFEKMQSGTDFEDINGVHYVGFARPIGQWNCMHIAMAFSTQYSKPRYTEKQLQDMAEANRRGCEINGKRYSIYEATQLMRQIETDYRRYEERGIAAESAGNREERVKVQKKLNDLSKKYNTVCAAAGQRPQRQRMYVKGYKSIKLS